MNKEILICEIGKKFSSLSKFADELKWSRQRLDYTIKNIHRIRVDQVQLMADVLELNDQQVCDIFLLR